jgi:hypothetical protein
MGKIGTPFASKTTRRVAVERSRVAGPRERSRFVAGSPTRHPRWGALAVGSDEASNDPPSSNTKGVGDATDYIPRCSRGVWGHPRNI